MVPLVNHVSVTTDETPDPVTDEETTPIGSIACIYCYQNAGQWRANLLQQPAKL